MPLPEGYLPREGDVLLVPARVKYDVDATDLDAEDGYRVFLRVDGDHRDFRIPLTNVVDIVSRKWNVGDEVVIDGDDEGGFGEVLAVHGDNYWLKYISARRREPTFATYNGKDLFPRPKNPVDVATMRFAARQDVVIARLPDDPFRQDAITPFIGKQAQVLSIEDQLYKVAVLGTRLEFYVSDEMLDPVDDPRLEPPPPAPSRIDEDGKILF